LANQFDTSELFEAIETITEGVIRSKSFDTTIEGKIVSAKQSRTGEY